MTEGKYRPGEEAREFKTNLPSWKNEIEAYCRKQYKTPTGHAYPNGVAFFLHTSQNKAEQTGDTETAKNLEAINSAYGVIALPFLTHNAKSAYMKDFYNKGKWL